jgi:hypothetical protein
VNLLNRLLDCLLLALLQVADNGDLQLVDATDGWKAHTPLYLAIVLSLVIAVLCALLVVGMLVLKGLDLLAAVNKDLQVRNGQQTIALSVLPLLSGAS